ncbi:alpha/beta hydrolase [Brachyspira alvinipulli]|uniref:alpha/beta hydrolase n=1 Tax=Brachyspira alvinipulli TaxID=84379 RepID=UPI0030065DC9
MFILCIIIFIIIAVLFFIIPNHFVNKIFIKTNKKLFERKEKDKKETEEQKQIKENRRKWFENSQKDIYTISSDNMKLHAHIIENDKSNIYVIIAHPYEGRGSYMKYFAEKYYNMGFNIILIDLRTHGDSEGGIYSLGYLERLDILSWIEYIKNNYENSQIILYGISMGANAVMMCSCENIEDNVKAIIEDAGFTGAKEQLKERLDISYKLPFFPIIPLTSFMTKIRLGFSFDDINVINAVSKSKVPILFIHGDKDSLVNPNMVNKLYDACCSDKEKLIIKNGEHIKAVLSDENLYWDTINNFIKKYTS